MSLVNRKFLLGFRKRKQERKEKYIEKLERDLVKEKRRIKQQTCRNAKKMSTSHSILPEVQSLIENMPEKTETYDLGNTLVCITSLDDQVHRKLSTPKEEETLDLEHPEGNFRRVKKEEPIFAAMCDTDDEGDLEAIKNDPFFNPINDDEFNRSDLSSDEEETQVDYNPMEMLRKQAGTSEPEPGQKTLSKAKLEREANRILQESEVFKKMQRIKQKRSRKFKMFRLQPTESKEINGKSDSSKATGKKSKGTKGKYQTWS